MAESQKRLPWKVYNASDLEYYFETIDRTMPNSDDECDVDLCTTPPPMTENSAEKTEPTTIFSWKLVKRRRPHRRYTTHGCSAPPAPPSTPTSLTASSTPTPSPTASSSLNAEKDSINDLLYIADYTPKYNKKLKEQQRTDAELAELFNVVTITCNSNYREGGLGENRSSKLPPERRINAASRAIRKPDFGTKIFKIHRNPKEFFPDLDEEDSVSAPEYDTEEEDMQYRLMRFKPSRRLLRSKRYLRYARFAHQDKVDTVVDNLDTSMNFYG